MTKKAILTMTRILVVLALSSTNRRKNTKNRAAFVLKNDTSGYSSFVEMLVIVAKRADDRSGRLDVSTLV